MQKCIEEIVGADSIRPISYDRFFSAVLQMRRSLDVLRLLAQSSYEATRLLVTFNPNVPADVLYALVMAMAAYAKEHRHDFEKIGNSMAFAATFPAEFINLLMTKYEGIEDGYASMLRQLPEYYELSDKRGRVRNGRV